jgi:hypothetical protein
MNGWKIIAIISILINLSIVLLFGYLIYEDNKQVENKNICYFEICEGYREATYEEQVCTCYTEGDTEWIVAKQKYFK